MKLFFETGCRLDRLTQILGTMPLFSYGIKPIVIFEFISASFLDVQSVKKSFAWLAKTYFFQVNQFQQIYSDRKNSFCREVYNSQI